MQGRGEIAIPAAPELQVIGAGFGRSGTTSLRKALQILGFAPCYHMRVALVRNSHMKFWIRAKAGEAVDYRWVFRRYRATVDWPACEFHKELMAAFPDAKVLLNVRDPDSSIAAYQAHLDEVRRTVPPERLLEHDVKEGWAPLCHFLDRPLPVDQPFPNLNDRAFFRRVMLALRIVEWLVPAMVIAALIWMAAFILR